MTEKALTPKGYTPSLFLGDASRYFSFESKKFIEALTHPQRRVVLKNLWCDGTIRMHGSEYMDDILHYVSGIHYERCINYFRKEYYKHEFITHDLDDEEMLTADVVYEMRGKPPTDMHNFHAGIFYMFKMRMTNVLRHELLKMSLPELEHCIRLIRFRD